MFRTRDFVLIFVTVVFLVVAIAVTVAREYFGGDNTPSVTYVETTDQEYSAELDEETPLSRGDRVVEMRRKIAESGTLDISTPETAAIAVAEEEEIEEEVVIPQAGVQKCPGYSNYTGYWSAQGIAIELSEGARVVSRVIEEQSAASTSTPTRDILIQLPAYPVRSGMVCLSSDVVGVAQDGSLIRNTEARLYGVFGEHTLIGYALDGFPIYGVSSLATDACGGTVVTGEYRYYLSDERETVLNCFAGTPVKL